MDTKAFLDKAVALFAAELKGNLSGIYLHGSLAMGCFNSLKSDIDLFIVVKEKLTAANHSGLARIALALHEESSNDRGIEFSIVLEAYLQPFVYPTPFEFHYSDYHREKYRADENYFCGGFEDEDLASQIVVAYERGIVLYGKPLKELYEPIDRRYFLASILHDIDGVAEEIRDNPPAYLTPVYLTLNLCRVLYYLKEGQISSKREGGEWGSDHVPQAFQQLVNQCLSEYNEDGAGGETGRVDRQHFYQFVDYMTEEIKRNIPITE